MRTVIDKNDLAVADHSLIEKPVNRTQQRRKRLLDNGFFIIRWNHYTEFHDTFSSNHDFAFMIDIH